MLAMTNKDAVRDLRNDAACAEKLLLSSLDIEGFKLKASEPDRLEPYIGLGLGAGHERFATAGASLHGIDLTPHSVEITRRRLEMQGWVSPLRLSAAEMLPIADGTFDFLYSRGVIHHSPDRVRPAREILRVLKPGGASEWLPHVESCRDHVLTALWAW